MKKVVLSLGIISLFAVQAHAQILFSDNFSGDTAGFSVTSLVNWNLNSGANVDVLPFSGFDPYAGQGHGQYIDLNGTFATSATTLTTKNSISLVGSTKYGLSFDLGKNGIAFQSLRVRVTDGVTNLVDQTISDSNAYATFQNQLFTFDTSASSVNIIFDQSGPSSNGYIIDNVLFGVVPEPTTLALFGTMGLPLLALVRRRRNS